MTDVFLKAGRVLPALALLAAAQAQAAACFAASGRLNEDAQSIRLKAEGLGWTVGVPTSLTAATVIKGKVALYPKGAVEVCLLEGSGALTIKAQATTSDAGQAAWRKLPARRIADA